MHREYDYLIIGAGMTADSAARGIREQGGTGSIGILGEELTPPFPRPALSKKLWTDPDCTTEGASLDTAGQTGAELHLGCAVVELDTETRRATTAAGDTFGYGRVLLATGGRPRRVQGLEASDRVFYFRTLDDYQRLRTLAAGAPDVVVVGGGYIGSEVASVLAQRGCHVVVVHPGATLGETRFPPALATAYQELFTDAGVEVAGGHRVVSGSQDGDGVTVRLDDGSALTAPVVVVELGIEPAGHLLRTTAEPAPDGGIVVDERLGTGVRDVYAAGDVATYCDPLLGPGRVEHVDNATTMGGAAGRIMAGSEETYGHTPCFYSDVFDSGYEAVGTLDPRLETVEDPTEDDGLVVYYLDDERVRGVLMWNCDGGMDAARALLERRGRPRDASELVGSVRS